MQPFERHQSIVNENSTTFFGTVRMVIPSGGPITRSCEIRIPPIHDYPCVLATVFSAQSFGPAFAVYQIIVNDLGGQTQIAISAVETSGSTNQQFEYWCSYQIIAKVV